MTEQIELTLVIRPDNGSLDIITFGYNQIRQQGENAVDFMLESITRRHTQLRPDGTVRWRLGEILQLFHPTFSPLGTFVLQVPGTIPGSPAPPAGTSIELQEAKQKLMEAERKLNMVQFNISGKEEERQRAEMARAAAERDKERAEQQLIYAQEEAQREKKGRELWEGKYQQLLKESQVAEEARAAAEMQREMLERRLEKTLQQLQEAIKKNNELAAQVAQGTDNPKLVQENKKLKQRVENLDLQVVELNDQIKQLKERIKELEDQPCQSSQANTAPGGAWNGDLP
jgi:hypothetical protein